MLAESQALKDRLKHVTVVDDKDGERPVQVFFRHPATTTEKRYPYITISLLDIAYAGERQESERTYYYAPASASVPPSLEDTTSRINYYPSEYDEADLEAQIGTAAFLTTDQFVPVDLMYQVTTFSKSARQDAQLTIKLLRRVFPMRRGFIDVAVDGTQRRLDLLDWAAGNLLDNEAGYKDSIFRSVYTVRMNAEIPQSDLFGVLRVTSVDGELTDHDTTSTPFYHRFSEDF
jgi:hypothetical protein